MIEVHSIVNSVLSSKTYILHKNGCDKAWLVDIGDIEPVLSFLQVNKLKVEGVFLTHGHFDHFYGLQLLLENFPECKVFSTAYTKQAIASEELNLSTKCGKPIRYEGKNVFEVHEGDEFTLFEGEPLLQIIEVPGHNPGCMAMIVGDYIFTGDAYIPELGVKDFVPYADKELARQSMGRLIKLAGGKTIFAGHQLDKIPLIDVVWLSTQQVVVTKDKDAQKINNWGSGFFFQYRERLFFVTADHVAHYDDFEAGERLGKDYYVWVFNNKNEKGALATMLTPINGIFSFDLFDLDDVLPEIPELKDIAFSIISEPIKETFLTHDLRDNDGNIIVQPGRIKICLHEEHVAELKPSDQCVVASCVKWNTNGIMLERYNAIHDCLEFKEINNEGYYVLKYPAPVIPENWKGISGGPVFNQEGCLIGMLIEVYDYNDTVVVVPMKAIMHLMDYAIQYEESKN